MLQFCPWEASSYIIYSENIPKLFFYSHIPAIIVALFVGFFVFYKSNKSLLGIILLIINILFSIWSIFDLILWSTNNPSAVMFFWSIQVLIEPLIYLLSFYLTYVFIKRNDVSFRVKILGILIYIPILIFLSSQYGILGVNLTDCTAIEGFIAQYYTYIIEFIFVISIFVFSDMEYKKSLDSFRKKEIITFSFGVIFFLLAFSWGNLIGSFTGNWTLAQAGLIGMPIFVAFLAYLIVKFHIFNIKLLSVQALIATLWFLVFGILFIRNIENVRIVIIFTLFLVTIVGHILIRSIKRDIEIKEELTKLNLELQNLIKQRESLMHLVTHKVKGSFTRSKYIFANMLDGVFGDISEEIKKRAEQGLESDNIGIKTVDLILNANNLQKGIVNYDMKIIDLKEIILNILEEKKSPIKNKGLEIEIKIKEDNYNILGDRFWLKEAINNIIENAIQYTKNGKIIVTLEKDNGKIIFSVKDTGIGIITEDKNILFTEGGRGKDSVKVNVDSTGYGLYSTKLIIDQHKGKTWGESEGLNKGSTFFIELPID